MAVPRPPTDLNTPISGADFKRLAGGNPLPGENPHFRRLAGAAAPPLFQNEDYSGLEDLFPSSSTKTGACAPGGAIHQGLAQGKGVHQIPGATTLTPPEQAWTSPGAGHQADMLYMGAPYGAGYGMPYKSGGGLKDKFDRWWKGPGGTSDPWSAYPSNTLSGLPSSIPRAHRPLPSGKDLVADWRAGLSYPYPGLGGLGGGLGGLGGYRPDLTSQISFNQLSMAEQRRQIKKYETNMKEQAKLAKKAEKLREKEARRKRKEQEKKAKAEKEGVKKLEKQMMSGLYPWPYSPPKHHPIPLPNTAPVAKKPEASKPPPAAKPDTNNDYKFVYLPSPEFGFMRPANSVRLPKEAGGKESVMSRTMMHAMTNLGLEDKHYHMAVINQPT